MTNFKALVAELNARRLNDLAEIEKEISKDFKCGKLNAVNENIRNYIVMAEDSDKIAYFIQNYTKKNKTRNKLLRYAARKGFRVS